MTYSEHIARLTAANDRERAITVYVDPRQCGMIGLASVRGVCGMANVASREVLISHPVDSPLGYATALHEIGHIRLRHFVQPWHTPLALLYIEIGAWRYAIENAIAWTPAMHRFMWQALRSYSYHADIDIRADTAYASLIHMAARKLRRA